MTRTVRILWYSFFGGISAIILVILLANFGAFGSMPSMEDLENPSASLASEVFAEDGTVMGKYYLEDRLNVAYKDLSPHLIHALVATEDERFYDHSGVDGRSLMRAVAFLGHDGGGSTITMQTAKNLFTENWITRNLTLRGLQKVKECIIAVKLERNFTKEEILTLYLNTVAFGDNIFGIRNASRTFFQKEPNRVSVEEAAVLIGMLKGATLYNPRRNPKLALDRRNTVMDQMVRNNFITTAEASSLKKKPIDLHYRKLTENTGLAPYFRMILGEEMKKWCKEHTKSDGSNYDLYKDGLKIYTTINPTMQLYAEAAMAKHLSAMQKVFNTQGNIKNGNVWNNRENILEAAMKSSDRWRMMKKDGIDEDDIKKSFFEKIPMRVFAWNNNRSVDTTMTPYDSIKYHHQMLQGGFLAMDPQSGEVKAWVGGIDFKTFKYDHVNINTKRQVGSTIKPLLYTLAIEDNGFTPNTPVEDVQQNFGGNAWVPATTTTCTGQTMPMSMALALSKNCATAYIMKQLGSGNDGAKRFVKFLKECSIESKVEPYPSIALGSAEISLYEMIHAYSMFPGRGFNAKPMYLTRIEDKNGNVLESFTPKRKEVVNDATAYAVMEMMQGVMQFGTGRRLWSYGINGQVAGKTGTTNDNSDAWFIGYTPQLIAGVWTGCDDRFVRFNSTALGQGSSLALPIWAYFYEKISNDKLLGIDTKAEFSKPETKVNDVVYDWIGEVPEQVTENAPAESTNQPAPAIAPATPSTEEISPESDYKPQRKNNNTPAPSTPVKEDNKPHSTTPVNTDPQPKPKAVMQPKK